MLLRHHQKQILQAGENHMLGWLSNAFTGRQKNDTGAALSTLNMNAQKTALLQKFGAPFVETSYPVAFASPDHIQPHGTANDNSCNKRFTAKLIRLLGADRTSVLDLGCSGGGQVRDFIENGYFAVGEEGSDYSLKRLRAEWLTIPEFLFTADITKPFRVKRSAKKEVCRFSAITLWEVIEHIGPKELADVMKNIDAHLLPGGVVVMSVSPHDDVINGVHLHQTVQNKEAWHKTFLDLGWTNHEAIISYFGTDFVRADTPEGGAPGSFHVVLTRNKERPLLNKYFKFD